MICPICGTENNDNANFCNNCGDSLKKDQKTYYEYSDKGNPNGETFKSTISPEMMEETINEDSYTFDDWLDSIILDKKWKIILKTIHDKVIWLGEKLVPVGQYIVQLIKKIAHDFSATITGTIVGAIIGLLISSIPLFGWILGPILIPLLSFVGAISGLAKDLFNKLPVEGQDALKRNVVRFCNGIA